MGCLEEKINIIRAGGAETNYLETSPRRPADGELSGEDRLGSPLPFQCQSFHPSPVDCRAHAYPEVGIEALLPARPRRKQQAIEIGSGLELEYKLETQ